MGLQMRMWLLLVIMFGILYGIVVGVGTWMGAGGAILYLILAIVFMGFQFLIGPSMVSKMMGVKWVSEKEEPELHRTVKELAERAGIPKPKVGISRLSVPNAFAFGRSQKSGRICITQGIQRLLSKDELKAVLGHEIAHLKHRDMIIITVLSVIPLICYWIAFSMMWRGMLGGRREGGGNYTILIGIGAMLLYFITNLIILYGSRIREYYADAGSVRIGNPPHHLATALYKLVYSSAQLQRNPQVKEELKRVEGVKAFFVNDISRAYHEIGDLKEVDRDLSGTIDQNELMELRQKTIKLGRSAKMMEILTTHPNMLKRIKHLSTLT